MEIKIFDLFDVSDIKISDVGLKRYINLEPKLNLKSKGRIREKFGKSKINLIERLINMLCVPGHRGKKHKISTGVTGKYSHGAKTLIEAFKIVEEKTKENPVQVFVRAVENSSPRDEITTIEYGGARYPQAVDCSPIRRINLALRQIVHGSHDKAFKSKKKIFETLADEIILASRNTNESFAVKKRIETEKQANAAR